MSEFDLPIVLILKFEALGQLGRAGDAEIALDRALAISPTNFDFHVRTHPPRSALRSMPTWRRLTQGRTGKTIKYPVTAC